MSEKDTVYIYIKAPQQSIHKDRLAIETYVDIAGNKYIDISDEGFAINEWHRWYDSGIIIPVDKLDEFIKVLQQFKQKLDSEYPPKPDPPPDPEPQTKVKYG